MTNSQLRQWVREGYLATISEGGWINGDPGTRHSALCQAENRIGEVVLIVVYDPVREGDEGNGKLGYPVTSFAPFRITAVHDIGSPEKIVGRFQRRYIVAGPQGGPDDDGIVAIQLTR